MKQPILFSLAAVFAVAIPSCDSPELVRKRDEQMVEISKLRAEAALMEEKLKNLPPDQSGELANVEAEVRAGQEEVKKLEAEIGDLDVKKRALEKEFEEYRRKYAIR